MTGGYDINGEFRDPFPCALSDIHECRGEVREEWVGAGTYEAYCELAREQIKARFGGIFDGGLEA